MAPTVESPAGQQGRDGAHRLEQLWARQAHEEEEGARQQHERRVVLHTLPWYTLPEYMYMNMCVYIYALDPYYNIPYCTRRVESSMLYRTIPCHNIHVR